MGLEFAPLHIRHARAFVQGASWQIAFHDLEIDMALTPFGESVEHLCQQRETNALTVRSGVDDEVADERAGPALRHGHYALRVNRDEAKTGIGFGIRFKGCLPLWVIRDMAAAVLACKSQ